ncbi:restriction endonuclease subunit S [Rickettsiales bacterium]|nr:restriction endonuclease subunit S [Rickettsiales bacterium]
MSKKIKTTEMNQGKQELVPKLRFPEFRDSGEWKEKSLKDLFTIGSGRDYKHLDNGEIPVYGTGGYMLSVNDYLYDGESVCIGRKGTIDKPVLLTGKFWTVDTLFYTHSFKECLPRFVLSIFQNIDWKKHNEAGGVPSLSKTNIEKLNVVIPKLKEQQKIADCLSSIDDLITAESEKLESIKSHKKGLMQNLFPSEGKTTPNFRFPEFQNDGEWEENEVGELFHLQDGYAFSSSDFVDLYNDTIQVIRITDINNQNKNEGKVYISKLMIEKLKLAKFLVMQDDLLLSLTGAAGFNFFLWNSQPALINQRTMKITPKASINSAIKILLNSLIYDKINEHGSGQNNNLSKESLKALKILIPKPKEQQKIADCLSSIDDLITSQTQKIDTLKTHKKGLMQQIFPNIDQNHKSK